MPRINRVESPTGIYHAMQRGVGKQIIFEDECDYRFYIKKLSEYVSLANIELIAYCLMDNHVHLLVKSGSKEDISNLMHRLGSSYANYYNQKYVHFGHVFQGRFACEIVDSEQYLLSCVRYIHNNPVNAGLAARESYKWSSYNDYVLDRGVTNREIIMSIIGSVDQFKEFSRIKDDTEVMDCTNQALTTKDGIEMIKDKYGYNCEDGSVVNRLCKKERDCILRELKKMGFTAKHIELITGVSRTIIYKA